MWPFRRGELIERVGASESAAHESDEQAILDMLVPRPQTRIDGQLRDGDALDMKALGVLGVDTAAVALLVAVRGSLNALWWIPTGALGGLGAALMAASGARLVASLQQAATQAVQIERVFEPCSDRALYDELYALYREIYLALKPTHVVLAGLRRQPNVVPTS